MLNETDLRFWLRCCRAATVALAAVIAGGALAWVVHWVVVR